MVCRKALLPEGGGVLCAGWPQASPHTQPQGLETPRCAMTLQLPGPAARPRRTRGSVQVSPGHLLLSLVQAREPREEALPDRMHNLPDTQPP